jgi:hypothetical protein
MRPNCASRFFPHAFAIAHAHVVASFSRSFALSCAEAIDGLLVEELGKPSSQLFASFSATPMAAASLAQVHAATLADGTKVAVKVQYPELRANMASDLSVFRTMGAQARDCGWPRVCTMHCDDKCVRADGVCCFVAA